MIGGNRFYGSAPAGGVAIPSTKQTAITAAYSTDSDDVGKITPIGSATSADFKIRHDVSLLADKTELIAFVNESNYIIQIETFTPGSMKLNTQKTDVFLSPGGFMCLQGDSSTNNIIFSLVN